jgi:hypothetical protein
MLLSTALGAGNLNSISTPFQPSSSICDNYNGVAVFPTTSIGRGVEGRRFLFSNQEAINQQSQLEYYQPVNNNYLIGISERQPQQREVPFFGARPLPNLVASSRGGRGGGHNALTLTQNGF